MKWLRTAALTGVLLGGTAAAVALTEHAGWPRQLVIPVELALMVVCCELIDSRMRSRREVLARWNRRAAARGCCSAPGRGEIRRGLRAAAGIGDAWTPELDVAARNLCAAATLIGGKGRDVRLSDGLEALLEVRRPVVQLAAAEALVRVGGYGAIGRLRTAALDAADAPTAAQFREAADRLHEHLHREGVAAPSHTSL